MSIKMMVRYSFDICFGPKLYQICKISSEGLFVDAYQKQFNIYCIQFKFHFQYICQFANLYPADHILISCSPPDSYTYV